MTIGSCLQDIQTRRCGVIPYVMLRPRMGELRTTQLWFLLPRHKKTQELSDFGGGVKKTESAICGGVRELHEESRGIFCDIYKSSSDMASCVAMVDNTRDMAEIFVPLDPIWLLTAQTKFENAKDHSKPFGSPNNQPKQNYSDEMSELVWVSEETFNRLIWDLDPGQDVMWKRIRIFLQKFLRSSEKFYGYLKNHAFLLSATKKRTE